MTSPAIDPNAVVGVAKVALDALPQAEKVQVFEHLLSTSAPGTKIQVLDHLLSAVTPEVLEGLSKGARDKFIDALPQDGKRQVLDNLLYITPEVLNGLSEGARYEFLATVFKKELNQDCFLGPEAWEKIGVNVGKPPPFPASITKALLNSECPFHPGWKIKNTHLLVLVPKTVDGKPYTPLALDELCSTRNETDGYKLIYDRKSDGIITWKLQTWASLPQAKGEWVLIPKWGPDPKKVSWDKIFKGKDLAEQQKVHDAHFKDYREVKALELMTTLILNHLVNQRPRWFWALRCQESNREGWRGTGRVCVGRFYSYTSVLRVDADRDGGWADTQTGFALARKL